jgi:S1-C subfamily serine protease
LGLRDGDAISAINGRSLKSVADVMSLLYEQRNGIDGIKTMEVRVMRDGVSNNLQLDFQ